MKIELLDKFQIAGFILSAVISIGLVTAGQDTIGSVSLGLALAVLTQLFDLQIRHTETEERLLKAGLLNRALYQDEWLLKHIQKIVNDYFEVRDTWFDLFKKRAQDSIVECRNVLHALQEGELPTLPNGPYSLGSKAIEKYARSSLKAVAVADFGYWRSPYSEKYWQANADAVQRGVVIKRVFVAKQEALHAIGDILERQKSIGVEVLTALVDETPPHLIQDLLIIDDCVYSVSELAADGRARDETVVIDPVEVEQAVQKFDSLLRYAKSL